MKPKNKVSSNPKAPPPPKPPAARNSDIRPWISIGELAEIVLSPMFRAGRRKIKWRAEHKLGDLIVAQKEAVGLNEGAIGKPGPGRGKRGSKQEPRFDDKPKLSDGRHPQDYRPGRKAVAAIPADEFEAILATRKPTEIRHYLKRKTREEKHKKKAPWRARG